VIAALLAALLIPAHAPATPFSNTTPITINDGAASLYPSTITPTGLLGTVNKVTVKLNGLAHTFLSDIDVLLVAPNGTAVVLMSDACTFFQTTAPVTLTFDDAAPAPLPPTGCLVIPATLKPFNNLQDNPQFGCDPDPDVFPAPAPPGPTAGGYAPGPQMLSSFNTMSAAVAMGTWSLFVYDDCATETGSINGGWTLDILSSPTAVRITSFSAIRVPDSVHLSWGTASETGVLGFNVVRFGPRGALTVNRRLIVARHPLGGTYRLVDRTARRHTSYRYRLQIVNGDGSKSWAGSARSGARR